MAEEDPQLEELDAIEAIYGDDCECSRESGARLARVWLPSRASDNPLVFEVRVACYSLAVAHQLLPIIIVLLAQANLPGDYPSASPPIVSIERSDLSDDVVALMSAELLSMFRPGEVVIYAWAEWLRESLAPECPIDGAREAEGEHEAERLAGLSLDDPPSTSHDDASEARGDDALIVQVTHGCATEQCVGDHGRTQYACRPPMQAPWGAVRVTCEADKRRLEVMVAVSRRTRHGDPFTERKSTFQAHCCQVGSVEEVRAVVDYLLTNNKIRNATHNIMAYRISVPGKEGVFLQDCDDDGEDAAGGRLLHLLQIADARDVVVVVSRWFGGVLLGPSRFSLINNAARALLEREGYISGGSSKTKKK